VAVLYMGRPAQASQSCLRPVEWLVMAGSICIWQGVARDMRDGRPADGRDKRLDGLGRLDRLDRLDTRIANTG
jgi:hypothetical protein